MKEQKEPTKEEISRVMSAMAKKGKGVPRKYTPAQRSAILDRLALAREVRWPEKRKVVKHD